MANISKSDPHATPRVERASLLEFFLISRPSHARRFHSWTKQNQISTGYFPKLQNYGPFLGTLNIRCRTILGTQKGTIILTTTPMEEIGFSEPEG